LKARLVSAKTTADRGLSKCDRQKPEDAPPAFKHSFPKSWEKAIRSFRRELEKQRIVLSVPCIFGKLAIKLPAIRTVEEMFMPRTSPESRNQSETASRDRKNWFDSLRPRIPIVVEHVCAHIHPRPQPADREDFVGAIELRLQENDYALLDSFHGDCDPNTWLFAVVRNYILNQLRKQRRTTSLDDAPPDALVVQPDQEPHARAEEIARMAMGAQSKLSPGEKRFFGLWLTGLSNSELADGLGIQVTSVESKKSRMFKKIRDMAGGR
jgi:RNA polymerase sigma factor (sigma-70 family)